MATIRIKFGRGGKGTTVRVRAGRGEDLRNIVGDVNAAVAMGEKINKNAAKEQAAEIVPPKEE